MNDVKDAFDKQDDEAVVKINFKRIAIVTGAITAVAGALVGAHVWLGAHLGAHLMTSAQGVELGAQLKQIADAAKQTAQAASDTAKALNNHLASEELKEAKAKLSVLTEQLSGTMLWESEHGANDISKARKRDLEEQINRVKEYLQCVDAGRSTCVQ